MIKFKICNIKGPCYATSYLPVLCLWHLANYLHSFSINVIWNINSVCFLEGKKHDTGMLRDSRSLENLEAHAFNLDGQPMCLYGDLAYPLWVQLQAPFRMVEPNPDMAAFNRSMSSVRVSLEWLFGDIVRSFKFMDLKIPQSRIECCWQNLHSFWHFAKLLNMHVQ